MEEKEKELCGSCAEPYNKVNHKKSQCCYCGFCACHRCVQRWILSQIQDPHCMNCKKMWTREFIDNMLPKQFINTELKNHRENILFEREKNLLPDTQGNVRLLQQQEQIDAEIKQIEVQIDLLQRRMQELEQQRNEIEPFRMIPRPVVAPALRISCPINECRGFVQQKEHTFACGICAVDVCHRCRSVMKADHTCSMDDIKSMELLDKDTKRCPQCCVPIFKANGCDQMWCTVCHMAFDWKTGEKVRGLLHNPHYVDYVEAHGVPIRRRDSYARFEFMDIELLHHELGLLKCPELTIYQLTEVYRYLIHYFEVDLHRLPSRFDDAVNLDLRIFYLQGNMSEEDFKMKLQRRQKDTEKKIEYRDIGETYVDIMNDLFLTFLENKNVDKLLHEIQVITDTTQQAITLLNKRYNSNMPLVRKLL